MEMQRQLTLGGAHTPLLSQEGRAQEFADERVRAAEAKANKEIEAFKQAYSLYFLTYLVLH